MSNVEVTLDDEEVRWWWYGIRGRACESGWSVCDSIQKVPSVRHLGEGHRAGHIRDAWGSVIFPCDLSWDTRHAIEVDRTTETNRFYEYTAYSLELLATTLKCTLNQVFG